MQCNTTNEAKEVIINEIVSNIVLGYGRAHIEWEQNKELPPIPDVFKEMEDE